MVDFSEQKIKADRPHCDPNSFALKHPLKETSRFWVVCDVHPLTEGHLLIIPKTHLSCVGEYDQPSLAEFNQLYKTFCDFIKAQYGSVSSFEHDKIGQTVFHSHVHILPFSGQPGQIIPEGEKHLRSIETINELVNVYKQDGQYLFFSIGDQMWTVDHSIGGPRFFRDRFAKALGAPQRGNWKQMHDDSQIMSQASTDIANLETFWKKHNS